LLSPSFSLPTFINTGCHSSVPPKGETIEISHFYFMLSPCHSVIFCRRIRPAAYIWKRARKTQISGGMVDCLRVLTFFMFLLSRSGGSGERVQIIWFVYREGNWHILFMPLIMNKWVCKENQSGLHILGVETRGHNQSGLLFCDCIL